MLLVIKDEKEHSSFRKPMLDRQQVKASRQHPAGLLQPLKVPQWKWEAVCMDFISSLPKTKQSFNVIWVVVDRLTKMAHVILGKSTYHMDRWAQLYISP